MNISIRTRLFLASVAVVLLVGLVTALYLRSQLRITVEDRVHGDLVRHAGGARIAVEALPTLDSATATTLAQRWSAASGVRIQLFSSDGAVLGDSEGAATYAEPRETRALPEIAAALSEPGVGTARRGGRLLVAIGFQRPDGRGVVRLSQALDDVDTSVGRLYDLLVVAALIGLVVAVVMIWLASHLLSRALRKLAVGARQLAHGDTRRVPIESGDELGTVGGALNRMAEDVDRTVAALARERGLLSSVLESMSPGVIALDAERRVTIMNDAGRVLLGLDDAPIGEAFIDHVRVPGLVELVTAPLDADEVELQIGVGVRAIARVAPAGDGCILVLEDVTAVRRLETIRRDFVANVSHELRTPVAVIRANAETLIGGAKDEPVMASRLLDGLHRNAERLSRIIDDLLSLSRIESGAYPMELSPVKLVEAVDQALAGVERAASRQPPVDIDLDDDLVAMADAHALDHVLVNLIDNAIKYTPPSGHIWVVAERRGAVQRIEVRDDGPGIAPHHRERIFERFYRVDPGRSRAVGGTGLGLSIVKHLVESMGGRVGVDTNSPRGAVFWIELTPAPDEISKESRVNGAA